MEGWKVRGLEGWQKTEDRRQKTGRLEGWKVGRLEVFNPIENQQYLQEKRDFFLAQFKDLPFTFKEKSEGSYFQIASYENISDLPDKEFCIWLTKEYQVATIPFVS